MSPENDGTTISSGAYNGSTGQHQKAAANATDRDRSEFVSFVEAYKTAAACKAAEGYDNVAALLTLLASDTTPAPGHLFAAGFLNGAGTTFANAVTLINA